MSLTAPSLRAAVVLGWLLVAGCSSSPPVPDWQLSAQGASERATEAYLSGVDRVATAEASRVQAAVASSGRLDLMARVALLHCAAQVASLVGDACPAYQALASDAAAPEQAYARYLAGQATAADAELLPAAHRPLLQAASPAPAVTAIGDPLSRLVAAGVLLRRERADDAVVAVAVDTASAQGWRRPLLAWLAVQRARLLEVGDREGAGRVQRRIDLVAPPPTKPP
jgi:outer membrane murein-binding lipoprotein Lpp